MKDHAQAIVVQLHVGPVVGPSSAAEDSKAGADGLRKSKEKQSLIDQMRPKIEPQSRARTWIFSPAPANSWPKTIDVRLVMRNFTKNTCLQDCARGKNLAFPAPIMEDGKNPPLLPSDLREAPRFCEGHGERFIDDNILPCAQCGGCERKMALIRASDHDQIDIRMCRHFL